MNNGEKDKFDFFDYAAISTGAIALAYLHLAASFSLESSLTKNELVWWLSCCFTPLVVGIDGSLIIMFYHNVAQLKHLRKRFQEKNKPPEDSEKEKKKEESITLPIAASQ